MLLSFGIEGVAYPIEFSLLIDADDIETGWARPWVSLQVMLRGDQQALLFACVDAGQCAAKLRVAAQAHFDEDQMLSVLHHQINFAAAAVMVAGDDTQPLAAQKLLGQLLGLLAARAFVHRSTEGEGVSPPLQRVAPLEVAVFARTTLCQGRDAAHSPGFGVADRVSAKPSGAGYGFLDP